MQTCPRCGKAVKADVRFCPECGAGLPTWTGRLQPGEVLSDRYTIVRPLARGGMGAVFVATDNRLGDAPFALKEMLPNHAQGETDAWNQAIAEFRREAALLARLSHPNLPHVIDCFSSDGREYLVMALIEGHTLRRELDSRTQPVPLAEARAWFDQLASVLRYLHVQTPPIIYRDLKPSNIMLRPDGRIVLIDFGIARLYKAGQGADTAIYGTPGYAPPEQYGLGQTDARADVYSLAMVYHEILTGFRPAQRTKARPPLAHELRPEIPAHVGLALNKALAPDPEERFASIDAFVDALDGPVAYVSEPRDVGAVALSSANAPSIAAPAPPAARPRWLWPVGLAALLVLLGGGWWLLRPDPGGLALSATATPAEATATLLDEGTPSPPTDVPVDLPPAPPGMVAIPAGEFIMGSDSGQPDERPSGTGFLATFFLDRTEVTNAQYRACVEQGVCTPPSDTTAYDDPARAEHPVVNVTWSQAQDYCSLDGRRLPTEAEWEKAARGTDGRTWTWGDTWAEGRANIWGNGIGALEPVGAYPGGASPYGALDMVGNAWEWTSSLDLPYPYNADDGRELPNRSGFRIIRGGSWGLDPQNARIPDRDRRQPESGNDNLGFRCASTTPFSPPGMDFIPAGSWTIGLNDEEAAALSAEFGIPSLSNEQPATVITTTAFFLDHTEVTNEQYAAFVAATGRPIPRNAFDPEGLAIWRDDGTFPVTQTAAPVVNVTWADAQAYCAWADKRLPTEAEWERAARGSDGRIWPWGDTWADDRANTADRQPKGPEPVGSYPAGAGPFGSLDLGGNVWEWTASLYRPYPYAEDDGRNLPTAPGSRVIRGGSWLDPRASAHASGRNSFQPDLANVNLGFRCALDIDSATP